MATSGISAILIGPSLVRDRQIVERNNTVGFRPQPNLAGGKGPVVGIDQGLAIEVADDVVPFGDHSQSMPLVGGDLHFRILELYPLSIHHSVETEIVLERVGADNIVASWIAESEDQPHALVHFAGEGLGFYAHVYGRIFSLIADQ